MRTRVLSSLALLSLLACSPSSVTPSATPLLPELSGPEAPAIPNGGSTEVVLNNGARIALHRADGEIYFVAESLVTDEGFARLQSTLAHKPARERSQILTQELETLARALEKSGARVLSMHPEVGFVSFAFPYESELFRGLKNRVLPLPIWINPVVSDRDAIVRAKAYTPQGEGLELRTLSADGRATLELYSGRSRIGVDAFLRAAQADIGSVLTVDGSSAKLGIADTGITLHHPAFTSARDRKQTRITYIKDFTGEGTAFIDPTQKLTARATEEADLLELEAELIVTPKIPARPIAETTEAVKEKFRVSTEQRELLLRADTTAKLFKIAESVFQAADEPVDVNRNGKVDDAFYGLYVPADAAAGTAERVWIDFTATRDLRQAKALRDFNLARETQAVFAERIGAQIGRQKIARKEEGKTLEAVSIAIVGFDPGNHGTHVGGIAAGSTELVRGIAPEAEIVFGRVCSNNGGCSASDAIADLALNAGAEVINMSLGGLSPFNDGLGVQEALINRLTSQKNVLFIISAGNSGPGRQTVGSPSTARLALSIGASANRGMIERQYQWPGAGPASTDAESGDFLLFFSSRGPSANGGFKPNLTAPGTELSAIQLNAAPGMRSGMDVYWGTSMSAPTAAGAATLLIDAIKKYNRAHPLETLPTDVDTLRAVLLESARPFDTTLDGSKGDNTWADQGMGMINLERAWATLKEHARQRLPSEVRLGGEDVALDYSIWASSKTSPSGNAYDGTRKASNGEPAFAQGLYLNATDSETLKTIHIARRLPAKYANHAEAGELHRQLVTTADTFELRTRVYGSKEPWLRAGVLDALDCAQSKTADLQVLGRGVEIDTKPDGTGELNPIAASALQVCMDTARIKTLPSGEHAALILGYRKVGSAVERVPSFIVPVYLTVPHQTMEDGRSVALEDTIRSFQVKRQFVRVPEGTTLLRITAEVPELKEGVSCSGIELMAMEGQNNDKAIDVRKDARVTNCTAAGAPQIDAKKRTLVFTRSAPRAGLWDIHVFGLYKYSESRYKLRVDYVTGVASLPKIEGTESQVSGTLEWTLKSASMPVQPHAEKSTFEIMGLRARVEGHQVDNEKHVFIEGKLGKFRAYPEGTQKVTIEIGGSPGNDLDMVVLSCPTGTSDPESKDCEEAGSSGGATDVEKVSFAPKKDRVYAVKVDGFEIHDAGKFFSEESLSLGVEKGTLAISGESPVFQISYGFDVAGSTLLKHPLFTSGAFFVTGALTLKVEDGTLMGQIPAEIRLKAQ